MAQRQQARQVVSRMDMRSRARRFFPTHGALSLLTGAVVLMHSARLHAQELEPRTYSNLPMGLNFLAVGYAHSKGGLSTDASVPLQDARLKIDSGLFAYVRALDLWGYSGKFDVIVPYSDLSGSAVVAGQTRERQVEGFGDPRFRLSINFYGAPALSLDKYRAYEQDLVLGASVQVSPPWGQYDPSRAVNLGTNRWSVKPDIGFSKAFAAFTFDFTAGVTFFSRNNDYFGGQNRDQAALYSTQANLSYDFGRGLWVAAGATYYWGGRTTVDGTDRDDALSNSRFGLTVALPLDRYYSLKFNASNGVSTRTGTSFDTVGLVLQYRWGSGL
jgi:hypothetical protein